MCKTIYGIRLLQSLIILQFSKAKNKNSFPLPGDNDGVFFPLKEEEEKKRIPYFFPPRFPSFLRWTLVQEIIRSVLTSITIQKSTKVLLFISVEDTRPMHFISFFIFFFKEGKYFSAALNFT